VLAAAELPAPRSVPRAYARHRPETTTLYEVVRDNLETLYGAIDDGALAVRVPKHAKKELDAYLSCGVLCRGFARLRCGSCTDSLLVVFSCKGRGFCPSCIGRRMCATAANMIEHVLPREAALRQWVLTFPFPWRAVLARDGALLGALTRIFLESVQAFYAKRADAPDGKTGAFTVIQRTSSDVRLHPHLHALVLDGVYREEGTSLLWSPTRHLQTRQVGEVLEHAVRRMARYLRRRHLLEAGDDDEDRSDDDAEGRLEASAVSGQTPPAGPSWQRGLPRPQPRALGYDKPLCASLDGFTLHAATRAGGHDTAGKEALLRYVLRPPVAQERVELRQDGLVRIVLKRPFADGTLAVEMDPLSLLARLAALRGAATVPHGPLRRRPRAGESLAKAHRPRAAARPRAGARGGGRSTEACRDVPAVGRASEAHVWVRRARLQNVRGAHEAPRGCHRSGERGAVPRDDRRAQRHPRALAEPGSALLEEHRPAPKGPGRRRVT